MAQWFILVVCDIHVIRLWSLELQKM